MTNRTLDEIIVDVKILLCGDQVMKFKCTLTTYSKLMEDFLGRHQGATDVGGPYEVRYPEQTRATLAISLLQIVLIEKRSAENGE